MCHDSQPTNSHTKRPRVMWIPGKYTIYLRENRQFTGYARELADGRIEILVEMLANGVKRYKPVIAVNREEILAKVPVPPDQTPE